MATKDARERSLKANEKETGASRAAGVLIGSPELAAERHARKETYAQKMKRLIDERRGTKVGAKKKKAAPKKKRAKKPFKKKAAKKKPAKKKAAKKKPAKKRARKK